MWCWRRMEKIFWTNRVKDYIDSMRKCTYNTCNARRKANWIGRIVRRNCLLKHGIEGKIEGK
jgi:hypothetical protein